MRNLTFKGCGTAIFQQWDWSCTFMGMSINDCHIGLDMTSVDVASVVMIDSEINNTPVGIEYGADDPTNNTIILENVRFNNVATLVKGPAGDVPGSTGKMTIKDWGRGKIYLPPGLVFTFQGEFPAQTSGKIFHFPKPRYEDLDSSKFYSVKADGHAISDGVTDDTIAINAAISIALTLGRVLFFDAGQYVVTSTIHVPSGSKIVGEAFSVIMSQGLFFADMDHPQPVVQVGTPGGSVGTVQWSDMIVSTKGPQTGAILIEWNVASTANAPSGMWDVHTRIGGFKGSELQVDDCPASTSTITTGNLNTDCIGAFMSMHITENATNLVMENVWLWTADHDVDDADLGRITVYAGRGLLIDSTEGNIWLYGTAAEHHVFYQYQLSKTKNIVMGQIQTETPYYQPNPDAIIPFPAASQYNDPLFAPGDSAWGLRIVDSAEVSIYGAGLYSFFANFDSLCSVGNGPETCQSRIFSLENSHASVFNLNTVGATTMVTINGADVVGHAGQENGFPDTLAVFTA